MSFDARVTPVRDGVAGQSLEGIIRAEVYLEPKPRACAVAAATIHGAPDPSSDQLDQLLFGEIFEVIEEEGAFAWGQARRDGYMGFVAAASLTAPVPEATHRVASLRTYAFEGPSIKSRAVGLYSMNSLVAVEATEGKLSKVTGAGWMTTAHLAPVGAFETDPAGIAAQFLGAPYLWGGRESLGLDCSGLTQAALFACGRACPRDSDQQEQAFTPIDRTDFGRGDLVFWKGHVAMGLGDGLIVHANGHHMATFIEPLDEAIERIAAAGSGNPTSYRRP
jgi:cell wall-associated NlpC family hydrolase